MKAFKNHHRVGRTELGWLYITVEYSAKVSDETGRYRLSIVGVEGPKRNGDASGSCGQCIRLLDRLETLDLEWSQANVKNLREV